MKINFARSLFSILFIAVFISSCKKSDDSPGEFTWNYNGNTYTATYVRVSSMNDVGANIIGHMGNGATMGTGLNFSIHPLNTGLFVIGPGENHGGFVDPQGNDLQTVGILQITSVSGNRLNGNFMLTVGAAGNQYDVAGTISNVVITN